MARESVYSSSCSSAIPRSRIGNDLMRLDKRLQRIRAVLQDAEEREIQDQFVKLWLEELKGLAYAADDVLDELRYEQLRIEVEARYGASQTSCNNSQMGEGEQQVLNSASFSSDLSDMFVPSDIVARIREINDRFDEVARDRDALHLDTSMAPRRVDYATRALPSSSLVNEFNVLGRKEEKDRIVDLLLSKDGCGRDGFYVIPIVGMGGVGKTTLAQLVYKDSRVCNYFDARAWVHVSEEFDVIRIIKDIIQSVSHKLCFGTTLNDLHDTLMNELNGKRFLLVLDDLWNERPCEWDLMHSVLSGCGIGKIIVTTRNESVARMMQTVPLYKLECLSEKVSWLLFRHYAFDGRDTSKLTNLVQIGKQIVKKCSGLPLAVKTLGGLLRQEMDEERWRDTLQSELWEMDGAQNSILPALKVSYYRMPAHLKSCFLYCSVFPKHYGFDKYQLVKLWLAHGYIQTRNGKSVEEIGSMYFEDLRRRSFLQPSDIVGEEKFKMHDMIHDLARSISSKDYCITDIQQNKGSCLDLSEVLHLNVHAYGTNGTFCLKNTNALRTLLFYGLDVQLNENHFAYTSICHLRVLALECNVKENFLSSVSSMKHLRYLSLDRLSVTILPESFCQLYNLQTLLLLRCYNMIELPCCLGKLVNLRYISFLGMKKVRSLPESLCQLYNLHSLELDCPMLVELPASIGNLKNLHYFSLRSEKIKRLPGSLCSLLNLESLHLADCTNLLELSSGLGQLVKLKTLDIPEKTILPRSLGLLINLRYLSTFNVGGDNRYYAGLAELQNLVNLEGTIDIRGLENVIDLKGSVNLFGNKKKLTRLRLNWKYGYEDTKSMPARSKALELDEAILENLMPHYNLKSLYIYHYGGTRYPKWIADPSFSNLSILCLEDSKCVALPPLGQLPYLKSLSIIDMHNIDKIGREFCSSNTGIAFPSLEKLEISSMSELLKWDGVLDEDFPHLVELTIIECNKLSVIPTFSRLQDLYIRELNALKSLCLHHNSSALQYLEIKNCTKLDCLQGLKNVSTLVDLTIRACPKLELLEELLPSNLHSNTYSLGNLFRVETERHISLKDLNDLSSSTRKRKGHTYNFSKNEEKNKYHRMT